MCFKKRVINLEKGKKIFFENHGGLKWAYRDFPEYYDCCVPKKIEREWTSEIEKVTLDQIAKSYGAELHRLCVRLSGLDIPLEKEIHAIIECLKNKKLDTFTTLILCEMLKSNYRKNKKEIKETVQFFARKMLNEPVTIDESYNATIESMKKCFIITDVKQYMTDRVQKLAKL